MQTETIAAISTARGPGAIGMVRLSGPRALLVADRVFRPHKPPPLKDRSGYTGASGWIVQREERIDDGVAFIYRAPMSYTGENVVEICCHGGSFAVERLLERCFEEGAQPAQPGEFTRRAFLNGKMDLSQAEAVADLIAVQGEDAMKAAYATRGGALSREINRVADLLVEQAAHIAAWSDYPEEDLVPVERGTLLSVLEESAAALGTLLSTYRQGRLLSGGIATAIVGKPNVGKSTLMNLLSGAERSIVTSTPGTTRDIVRDTVTLDGMTLHLMDTAGIHETPDEIEQIGVERALAQIEAADLILAVFDRSEPLDERDRSLLEKLGGKRVVGILNKTDLPGLFLEKELSSLFAEVVGISAKTGEGRDLLAGTIRRILNLHPVDPGAAILFHQRQRNCVAEALASLQEGALALSQGMTLDAVGVCVEDALDRLLSLTGKRASDMVLDEVFSRFCVGK